MKIKFETTINFSETKLSALRKHYGLSTNAELRERLKIAFPEYFIYFASCVENAYLNEQTDKMRREYLLEKLNKKGVGRELDDLIRKRCLEKKEIDVLRKLLNVREKELRRKVRV